jgi:tetratricopeptide (TPR) repeat protein
MSTEEVHLARAEAEARALIGAAPNAAYGYSLLGFISYERGALADTVRYLTRALELDGSDADAMFFRGIALEAAGQGEAAIAAGKRFLDVDPLAPMAGVLLNSAHWFVEQPQEGLGAHEQSLVLDPENPIIHWSLGYTYALLGRLADARMRMQWMQTHVPQMPYTVQLTALLEGVAGRTAAGRAAPGCDTRRRRRTRGPGAPTVLRDCAWRPACVACTWRQHTPHVAPRALRRAARSAPRSPPAMSTAAKA